MQSEAHDVKDSATLPHPLERFTAGGPKRGVLRLVASVVVVAVVIAWTGAESLASFLDP
ncbi:MAG: hypothetical protein VB934_14600 [Polyangiaceae bacterium]